MCVFLWDAPWRRGEPRHEASQGTGGDTIANIEFKECPVCKANSVPINPGGLDGVVKDKYNQLIPAPRPPLKEHTHFKHCNPPDKPEYGNFSVFTAGSIEMGAAVQWQKRLIEPFCNLPITITNPH